MIVMNGMLKTRFEEFAKIPDKLFFISFHYLELKRLNKFDVFSRMYN